MISDGRMGHYPIKIPIRGYNVRLDMISAITIFGCLTILKIADSVFKLVQLP